MALGLHRIIGFALAAMVAGGGCFVSRALADAPSTQAAEKLPDEPQLMRWDLIVSQDAIDAIRATGKPVQTKSVVYSALMCSAADLRGAISEAKADGGVVRMGQYSALAQEFGMGQRNLFPLQINYYQDNGATIGLQNTGGFQQGVQPAVADGAIKLKIDNPLSLELTEFATQQRAQISAMLDFDGSLKPGDALAMIGQLTAPSGVNYFHVIVWEVFSADMEESRHIPTQMPVSAWLDGDVKGAVAAADRSIAWTAAAEEHPAPFPAAFQKTLSDGKTVKLLCLTDPHKWYGCGWDPAGNASGTPLLGGYFGNDSMLMATAQVDGDAKEWQIAQPAPGPYDRGAERKFQYSSSAQLKPGDPVVVNVSVGPWQQLGEVTEQQPLTVNGETYALRPLQGGGNQTIAEMRLPQATKDEITLTAVTADGVDHGTGNIDVIRIDDLSGNDAINAYFQQVNRGDVVKFHVWKRARETVTFSGYATVPLQTPQAPSAAELASAEELLDNHQTQDQADQMAAAQARIEKVRVEWSKVPADSSTAIGVLRVIIDAAKRGDVAGVRARLMDTQPDSGAMLDTFAKFIANGTSAHEALVARYGKKLKPRPGNPGMEQMAFMDFEAMLMQIPWKPKADGGLNGGNDQIQVIKNSDGAYALDFSGMPAQEAKQETQMLTWAADLAAKGKQILADNPNLSERDFWTKMNALGQNPPAMQ